MRQQFPTSFEVEFRGVEPSSTFPDKATGELITRPATVKAERELPDGDVQPVELPLRDDLEVTFDWSDCKRGEALWLDAEVMCWNGRNGGGYFLVPVKLTRLAETKAAPLKTAS